MNRWERLADEAVNKLATLDFDSPQLNLVMKDKAWVIAQTLATAANNLPWQEWADDPDEVEH